MDTGHQSVACDLRYCMPWRGQQSPRTRLGRDYVERWVGQSMWKTRLCILLQVSHQTESVCCVYPAMWILWPSSPARTPCYTSISIIPCHLFGSLMSPLSLAQGYIGFYASLLGQPSLQRNCRGSVLIFARGCTLLWALRGGSHWDQVTSPFSACQCSLDFAECNGFIDQGHAWLLFEEIEDGIIDMPVVVEHVSKMYSEHWHLFFCIWCKFTTR